MSQCSPLVTDDVVYVTHASDNATNNTISVWLQRDSDSDALYYLASDVKKALDAEKVRNYIWL